MALSDLAVFNEQTYLSFTEVLKQQIGLFNSATNGAVSLSTKANMGDYDEKVFWGKVSGGLTRRRNAYGTGAIAQKVLAHKTDRTVKVAAGTYEIRLDPGQFHWIQRSPEEAGAAMGQQMAKDTLADMLNTALGVVYTALVQVTAVVHDATGITAPGDQATWGNITTAASKFGDSSGQIVTWIAHSVPMFQLWQNNLTNGANLFQYGNVNVIRDPFGRPIVVTDSARLVTVGSPNVYHTLGLVPGAVSVEQNDDFDQAEQVITGQENIIKTYQAEWSYNVGVKGFAWDKTAGGHSPADAALFTSTNWDSYVADNKDLAGVILETN